MRKIVLPTDFSANAFNALRYAVELFKYEKCEFFILHAYADEVYDREAVVTRELLEEFKESVLQKSNAHLEEILSQIQEISPNPRHSFETLSAFGVLVDEVNDLINEENADLCLMGTRGKTNDRSISFGSNTLQVLKYVQCPVLCIPADYHYKKPDKLLFPTDYMVPYQKRELKLVTEFARSYRSEIHVLYVSKFPPESFRQKDNQLFLKEQFFQTDFYFHWVDEPERFEAIVHFIEQNDIDMLIMVNSRHSYLESILYESTIDKIGLHPKIPFLVLQNFNRAC